MIWHGISMNAARNVANSIRNKVRLSALWLWASGPVAGVSNALQAFRLQANDAITMYAQLLTRLSKALRKTSSMRRSSICSSRWP